MKTIPSILILLISSTLFFACSDDNSPLSLEGFVKTGTLIYERDTLDGIALMSLDVATGKRFLLETDVTFRSPVEAGLIVTCGKTNPDFKPDRIYVISASSGSRVGDFRPQFGTEVDCTSMAISPDGEKLVYTGIADLGLCIIERRLVIQDIRFRDTFTILSIGSGPDSYVRFSPDGSRIAFFDREFGNCCVGNLYVVNKDGTGLTKIVTSAIGANDIQSTLEWSPDGSQILYSFSGLEGVRLVSAAGGTPTIIDFGRNPSWTPDGKRILYTKRSGGSDYRLATTKPDGTNLKIITPESAQFGAWSPKGSMIAYTRFSGSTVGSDSTIIIRDIASGTIIDSIKSAGRFLDWVD